eukprot:7263002-Pyramimonas_sp.AAC.2
MGVFHCLAKFLFAWVLVQDYGLNESEKRDLARVLRQHRTEQECTKQLQTLSQQKETFLSATTHELRTPLNAIIGT